MMPDRDTVVNRMETICNICKENTWRTELSSDIIYPLLSDAIALLKEQKDVSDALVDQCDRVRRLRKELAEQPRIVRCKECKYWKQYESYQIGECEIYKGYNRSSDWFCADGERRTDGHS